MSNNPFKAPDQPGAAGDASRNATQEKTREMILAAFDARVREAEAGESPHSSLRTMIERSRSGILNRGLLEIMRGVTPTMEDIAAIPHSQIVRVFHDIRSKSPGNFFTDHREVKLRPSELAAMTGEQRHDYVHTREFLLAKRAREEATR